jgi:hypothetical protein
MSTNVSTDAAREVLRREHGVRVVTRDEEGTAAADLPAGVYGFTGSPALASPLFATRRYRNFEVHRLPSGPAVVGFVTANEAAALTAAHEGPVQIRLLPDPAEDAQTLVVIPYDRIIQHRQYAIRNAEAITLHVAPTVGELVSA